MRKALVAAATLIALAACDGDPAPPEPPRAAPPVVSPTPQERPPTTPEGVVVENRAFGRTKRLAARALKDLKELGFWRPLTKRLYIVRIQSREGRVAIPDDGHLADVLLQAQVDEDRAGALCNIMFFPTAIADDLARWRNYHAAGYLPDPAPTLRQFWVSILAHELAHCLPAHEKRQGVRIPVMSGEPVSERWEARVLEAARQRL